MDKKMDFGNRIIQEYHTSYIIVIPKALISALGLKRGTFIKFILDQDGVIMLRPEVQQQ